MRVATTIEPSALSGVVGKLRKRKIPTSSHLDCAYAPKTEDEGQCAKQWQDALFGKRSSPSSSHVYSGKRDTSQHHACNDSDHAQFTYDQALDIIDRAVRQFWGKFESQAAGCGMTWEGFGNIAKSFMHACPCDPKLGAEVPVFLQTQVRQLVEMVTKRCLCNWHHVESYDLFCFQRLSS